MIFAMNTWDKWESDNYVKYREAIYDLDAMNSMPEDEKVKRENGAVVVQRGDGHEEVVLKNFPGKFIDEGLASVMNILIENNIKTSMSCQGGPRPGNLDCQCNGYITFASAEDLARGTRLLAGVAFENYYISLGTRILGRDYCVIPGLVPGKGKVINEVTSRSPWEYILERDWFTKNIEIDTMRAVVSFHFEDLALLDTLIRLSWSYPEDFQNEYYSNYLIAIERAESEGK